MSDLERALGEVRAEHAVAVVHRDLGPDFEHVCDGRACPCGPVRVDTDAAGPLAELADAVRRELAAVE